MTQLLRVRLPWDVGPLPFQSPRGQWLVWQGGPLLGRHLASRHCGGFSSRSPPEGLFSGSNGSAGAPSGGDLQGIPLLHGHARSTASSRGRLVRTSRGWLRTRWIGGSRQEQNPAGPGSTGLCPSSPPVKDWGPVAPSPPAQ